MNAMTIFNTLSKFILPKAVDFFGNLYRQSLLTREVIVTLHRTHCEKSMSGDQLKDTIAQVDQLRKKYLSELNMVMLTPIDKEAISRAHLCLDWVVLSVKHFNTEITIYQIDPSIGYEKIFINLIDQMEIITNSFLKLKNKQYDQILHDMESVISLDDELIAEYSRQSKVLFEGSSMKDVLTQREILFQLKEVSKHIHICANTVEDMVFKMH